MTKSEQLTIDDFLNEEKSPYYPLETRAELIREWAIERNLHTADSTKQALKLGEEMGELFEGFAKGNEDLLKDAIGDMYVVLTILSQQRGFTIEECIDLAYEEIKDRKGKMIDGVFVKEADLNEVLACE
ncbi:MazG-like family protein [Oceanobacillus neutriphilus]|uniref:NTP pyrophosphohydrolase MazG-like domain-containing protein n=1 Tax=Oceanobacillus neutriphilus TaxID=531815 RepID=A0ABQ2NYB9_9BACI|nr:MazG-like family protein [Oceanobacillus neutriphilus]GGP13516.1 hypothetical protein GCM10011346_33820 [Oceanobacillus neutriphilus]